MRDHVAAAASDGVAARLVGYVRRNLLSNGGDAGRRLWVVQTQRITTNNNTINIIVRVRQWGPETMAETVDRERADGGQRLKGPVRFVSVSVVRSPLGHGDECFRLFPIISVARVHTADKYTHKH